MTPAAWVRSSTWSSTSPVHGASGEGDHGPDLGIAVSEHADHDLIHVILNGVGEEVPAFNEREEHELADLVAYLRETHGAYEGAEHDDEH